MKTKKSKKANLENKRGLFFQIGVVLVLISVLAAFEWRVKISEPPELIIRASDEPIELSVPITRPEQEQKEKSKPVAIIEPIIVPDSKVIIDEPEFISLEDYPDIAEPVFVAPAEIVDEPETDVDIKPRFMGKDDKTFREWIISKIRFPDQAVENNLAGVVKVKFIVGTDGKLSNIEIVRSVHPIIDKEVLRVIGNSPEWEPGFKNGKYVRTWYSISISFKFAN